MSEGAAIDHATLERAAQWYALLQASPDDAVLRVQWQQWLEQGPAQRLAWGYVERVSQRFDGLRQQGPAAHQTLTGLRAHEHSRRQLLSRFGLLAGVGVLGWLGWRRDGLDRLQILRAQYSTSVGERRSEQLSDGTQLWLNTGTALDVRFEADTRDLILYAGEVLIDTGHRDNRPLRVRSREGLLEPLGTRFSVRENDAATQLNVYQGAVRITCRDSRQSLTVQAGQQVLFDALQPAAVTRAEARREAWSRGLLLAEDMPLGQFLAELGSYRRGHLGVDPAVANLRVMGSFPLTDTDKALAQLEDVLPVRVQRRFDWWVSVVPRPR